MRTIGLLAVLPFFLLACGSSSTSTDSSTGIKLVSAGDFDASASASLNALIRSTTTGLCSGRTDTSADAPDLTDGLDCDGDNGIVAHITPTQYTLAFKRVSLISDDGQTAQLDLVADTGTLAAAEVVDFTEDDSSETVVTINATDLTAGTYTGIEAEIYYFQMTMPVNGTTYNVRIYMSDDDFPSEGNLGHHQGDITYISDNGTELGWIDDTWSDTSLSSSRGAAQNGAGNENATNGDPETGHQRGFFGNADLWDQTDFMQGASQDVYIFAINFDTDLVIPDPSTITDLTTITVTFSTADTFYYEDFAPQGTGFNPGLETVVDTGEWAPLTPTASITVD